MDSEDSIFLNHKTDRARALEEYNKFSRVNNTGRIEEERNKKIEDALKKKVELESQVERLEQELISHKESDQAIQNEHEDKLRREKEELGALKAEKTHLEQLIIREREEKRKQESEFAAAAEKTELEMNIQDLKEQNEDLMDLISQLKVVAGKQ